MTVYRVDVSPSGNTGTDAATIGNAYGKAGDSITIHYTLDNTGTQSNTLTYSGVASPPAKVTAPGTSTSTYTIAAVDAANGIITITATFAHTDAPPSKLPKTGDGFPMWQLLALMGACLAGMGWMGFRRRSKKAKV